MFYEMLTSLGIIFGISGTVFLIVECCLKPIKTDAYHPGNQYIEKLEENIIARSRRRRHSIDE